VNHSRLLERPRREVARIYTRNPWVHLLHRSGPRLYSEDGLWTRHGHAFIEDERFARAYRRAVEVAGADYGIRWRVHTILWAAEHGAALEGSFVECGTGRGFMASAICEYLDWTHRLFCLYDTFCPVMPDENGSQAADGIACSAYAESPESVAESFVKWPGVQLIVGEVPGTLLDAAPVAFLHIDLNHAASEEAAVRHFWPKLTPGAPVIFDDYGFPGFEAQRETADRLGDELGFRVLTIPTGQGLALR
jgi:hypothetical protein